MDILELWDCFELIQKDLFFLGLKISRISFCSQECVNFRLSQFSKKTSIYSKNFSVREQVPLSERKMANLPYFYWGLCV